MRWSGVAVVVLGLVTSSTAWAQRRGEPRVKPTPFDQGKVSVNLGGGLGSDGGQLGAGVGYFVVKGLELSIDGAVLFREETIGVVGPGVRYIVWQVPKVHPYVGSFYRHWFVGGPAEDLDSIGARGGVVYQQSPFYVSGGVVYERFLACEGDCGFISPELSFGVSF